MKKIGVPINLHSKTAGIGTSYFNFLTETFENVEVIFLNPQHSIVDLDLLLLPGGADVNPVRYAKAPTVFTSYSNPYQEYFDAYYLPQYIKAKTPIFGICRGHQTLNVYFGGKLIEVVHPTNPTDEPSKEMHKVFPVERNFNLIKSDISLGIKTPFKVNSRHHQGFNLNTMSKYFIPLFTSENTMLKDHSCIEAFTHKNLPIVSVQWHPEDLYDDFSLYAIDYLLTTKKSILNEKILSKITY